MFMSNLIGFVIPTLVLALSVYNLIDELSIRRLQTHGIEAAATVVRVEHTIAFGLRSFLTSLSNKPEREKSFGCDYILSLRFALQNGEETVVQTAVPARMKIAGGERMPYFMEGDSVPVRYAARSPKRLVVMLDEVAKRQSRLLRLVSWGFCSVLMLAILITMLLLP